MENVGKIGIMGGIYLKNVRNYGKFMKFMGIMGGIYLKNGKNRKFMEIMEIFMRVVWGWDEPSTHLRHNQP